jgi:hypothetical protein
VSDCPEIEHIAHCEDIKEWAVKELKAFRGY